MHEDIDKAYSFDSLDKHSFGTRLFIRVADLAFYGLIRVIGLLVSFEVEGIEHIEAIESSGRKPIYCFWHDQIFLSTYYFRDRGIVVLTSQSRDGEYIARFIKRFGYGAVRGSSSRGGVAGLVEMIRLTRKGLPMGLSVDGPKGPRHVAKSGAVMLAKKSGFPILPFAIRPQKYWTVNSWDKLVIPKPFTTAIVTIEKPIEVSADASEAEQEVKLVELQSTLDRLAADGGG